MMNEKELKAYKLGKLKETATELGIEFSANIGLDSLLKKVKEQVSDFDETSLVPDDMEISDAKELVTKVTNKIVERGVTITPEMEARIKALTMTKVTIHNLDPQDSEKTTVYKRISNSVINVARILPIGVPIGLEACLVKALKKEKMIIYVAEKDKNGVPTGNKTHKEVPKYNIENH